MYCQYKVVLVLLLRHPNTSCFPAESEQSLMKMIITPCSWVLDRCNKYTYCQCNGPKSPGYELRALSSVLCLSELSVMGLFDC
jgi:hypothetical protein